MDKVDWTDFSKALNKSFVFPLKSNRATMPHSVICRWQPLQEHVRMWLSMWIWTFALAGRNAVSPICSYSIIPDSCMKVFRKCEHFWATFLNLFLILILFWPCFLPVALLFYQLTLLANAIYHHPLTQFFFPVAPVEYSGSSLWIFIWPSVEKYLLVNYRR